MCAPLPGHVRVIGLGSIEITPGAEASVDMPTGLLEGLLCEGGFVGCGG